MDIPVPPVVDERVEVSRYMDRVQELFMDTHSQEQMIFQEIISSQAGIQFLRFLRSRRRIMQTLENRGHERVNAVSSWPPLPQPTDEELSWENVIGDIHHDAREGASLLAQQGRRHAGSAACCGVLREVEHTETRQAP